MLESRRPRPESAVAMLNSPAFGLVGIGFYLATAIVGMTWLGHWLDGRVGSEPLLTLVFLVFGLGLGFYGAYRRLRDVLERIGR